MGKLAKLKPGQTAPDFAVEDITGRVIKLADYNGQKLLLCFFRYAGCPWCNLAIHRLIVEYPRFEQLGLKVIVFVQSQPENIKRYILERHIPPPPFPMIADPGRKIYQLYGVDDSLPAAVRSIRKIPSWLQAYAGHRFKQGKIDGSLTLVPAQFLIGQYDLKIYKAHYGADYFDDLTTIEILDFAQFGGH